MPKNRDYVSYGDGLYKRGNIFWAVFVDQNGKKFARSAQTRDEDEGRAFVERMKSIGASYDVRLCQAKVKKDTVCNEPATFYFLGINLCADHLQQLLAKVERKENGSLIYFVRGTDGHIKIGCTTVLEERMRVLKHFYGPVELLALKKGDKVEEARLHELFAADREDKRKEWFYPSEQLMRYITAVSGNTPSKTFKSF